MKTLLRIDSSARTQGSHSRELADYFQTRWIRANPDGKIIVRDLARNPVPHLDNTTIAAFHATEPPGDAPRHNSPAALSDALIAELKSANQLLISSPLYNLNVPSSLKAYFDHVVRGGHTFSMDENGYTGLLAGKSAVVITARGGQASSSVEDDYQTPFLKSILKFIGFDAVEGVSLEGTGDGNGAITEVMTRARRKVDLMFDVQSVATQPAEPQWLGAFTAEDREEIAALRAGQATAIQNRDAEAYARLCADDIQLMVPGHDIVSGRQHLLDWETKIFRGAHFASFKKTALRVERSGDIAVEIGRQELVTSEGSNATGVFASRQKYSHVFRKTAQGWRFIVLMSNSNA